MDKFTDASKGALGLERTNVFKKFQERLMSAPTKEDMKKITKEPLLVSDGRYKDVREFALEGNWDISERLQFY